MMTENNTKVSLNLNEIPHSERHSRIFNEFDRLKLGEAMEILVDHDPKLLQRQFKTLREGTYSWQMLEASEDAWRYSISKIKDVSVDQKSAEVEGCCGICGND